MSEPTDEELLAAFLDGDDRAFDALVDRYQRRVFAICYRYFRNASDAEDAMQDAFVALLRRGHTFGGSSSFSTWMYRVATNACNDLARKRSRRPQRDDTDVDALADHGGFSADLEEQLAATTVGPELTAALGTLEPDHREAIVLHDVYGLGYAEIAERSGVAVGTVKSRIHRGHARLAAALAAPGPAPRSDEVRPPGRQESHAAPGPTAAPGRSPATPRTPGTRPAVGAPPTAGEPSPPLGPPTG